MSVQEGPARGGARRAAGCASADGAAMPRAAVGRRLRLALGAAVEVDGIRGRPDAPSRQRNASPAGCVQIRPCGLHLAWYLETSLSIASGDRVRRVSGWESDQGLGANGPEVPGHKWVSARCQRPLLVLADGHSGASLVLALFFLRDMKGQDGKGTKTRQFPRAPGCYAPSRQGGRDDFDPSTAHPADTFACSRLGTEPPGRGF